MAPTNAPLPVQPLGERQPIEHVAALALGIFIALAPPGPHEFEIEVGRQRRDWFGGIGPGRSQQRPHGVFAGATAHGRNRRTTGKGRKGRSAFQHHADVPDVPPPQFHHPSRAPFRRCALKHAALPY